MAHDSRTFLGATLTSIGAVVAVMLLFVGGPTTDGSRTARHGSAALLSSDGDAQASRLARGNGAASVTDVATDGAQGGHLSAQLRAGQTPQATLAVALKD